MITNSVIYETYMQEYVWSYVWIYRKKTYTSKDFPQIMYNLKQVQIPMAPSYEIFSSLGTRDWTQSFTELISI